MEIVNVPAEVKPLKAPSNSLSTAKFQPPFWCWWLLLMGVIISSTIVLKKITIEEIEQNLNSEELAEYKAIQQKIDDKHENCEQYFLVATVEGQRICRSCPPGLSFVTLKKGEIFYIGYTCLGDSRHSRGFLDEHEVIKLVNFTGTRDQCHNMELKLINGYKYLEESLKPEAKLVIPPYNINKMN